MNAVCLGWAARPLDHDAWDAPVPHLQLLVAGGDEASAGGLRGPAAREALVAGLGAPSTLKTAQSWPWRSGFAWAGPRLSAASKLGGTPRR